jgi:hypothetical protein
MRRLARRRGVIMSMKPLVVMPIRALRSVKIFFKWIKQPLCIKRFFWHQWERTKTRVWCAIVAYVPS